VPDVGLGASRRRLVCVRCRRKSRQFNGHGVGRVQGGVSAGYDKPSDSRAVAAGGQTGLAVG
jgi:hypothetical protein